MRLGLSLSLTASRIAIAAATSIPVTFDTGDALTWDSDVATWDRTLAIPLDAQVTFPDLTIGASWSGTEGSGAAAPSESATPYSTGPTGGTGIQPELKVIGGFLLPDNYILEADRHVTVTFGTFADLWMDSVEIGWEGTTVTAEFGINPDDDTVGWVAKLIAPSSTGRSTLWARGIPKNGLERVVSRRVWCLKTGVAARETRYIAAGGSDAADGLTVGTAWATLAKVHTGMTAAQRSGAIINIGAGSFAAAEVGSYATDMALNSGAGPAPISYIGAGQASTTITGLDVARTDNTARWGSPRTVYRNLFLDLSNVVQVYGVGNVGTCWIDNCKIWDNWHASIVGADGYPMANSYTAAGNNTAVSNNYFRVQDGMRWTVTNCTDVKLACNNGMVEAWNNTMSINGDVRFLGGAGHLNYLWQNNRFTQDGNFESRIHLATEATITAIDTVTEPGKTWVAFAGDTFDASQMSALGQAKYFRLIGTNDGRTPTQRGNVDHERLPDGTRPFDTMGYRQDDNQTGWNATNNQVRFVGTPVTSGGTLDIEVGDTMRGYILNHGDAGQLSTSGYGDLNSLFIDNEFYSHNWQLYLWVNFTLSTGGLTATGTGTSITLSSLPTWSNGNPMRVHDYLVIANEWRRIKAISGNTVTISSAFSSDPSGASFSVYGSCVGWMEINTINHRGGVSSEFGQIDPATFNSGFITSTFPGGRSTDGLCIGFRKRNSVNGGLEGFFLLDCIARQFCAGDTGWTIPQANIRAENNHFETLNAVEDDLENSDGTQPTGTIWTATLFDGVTAQWDAGYVPNATVTETVTTLRWPYDLNGNARTVGSKVGAVLAL